MKNKLKQFSGILSILCMISIMISLQYFEAFGATGRISFSDPTASIGENVSVTMKVEATDDASLGSVVVMLSYDANILEFIDGDSANGGAGSIKIVGFTSSTTEKAMSFKLNFKTLQAGTSAVSVTSQEVYSFNEELMNIAKVGASSVTVKAPATFSNDADLASLAISPGTPGFSPDVTSYTASVGADVSTVVVGAKENQSGAKLSIGGNTNLKAGSNKVTCKVTAEDKQTVKTYTIVITKAAGEETTTAETTAAEVTTESTAPADLAVVVNHVSYSIAASIEGVLIPEGYEETAYTYKGTEIASVQGIVNNLKLIYLVTETGEGNFFIYNETEDSFQKLQNINLNAKVLTIMPLADDVILPDGYVESAVNIKGEELIAYVPEDELGRDFCLFYAMNWNGEESLYQYDFKEETAQRYKAIEAKEVSASASEDLVKLQIEFNKNADKYNFLQVVVLMLGIVSLVLIMILIYILLIRKNKETSDLDEDTAKDEILPVKTRSETFKNEQRPESISLEDSVMERVHPKDHKEKMVKNNEEIQEPDTEMDINSLSKYLNELDYLKELEEPDEEDDDFEFLDIDDH